MYIYLQ